MIIPTGGGAMMSAEKSLDLAIEKAGIKKEGDRADRYNRIWTILH